MSLPAGYEMEFGGEFAERNEAVGSLSASLGILVVLMAATLVLSFGSFRLAAIVAVVAGLSAGLGLGSLWLFGYPFGFMAIVGTMGSWGSRSTTRSWCWPRWRMRSASRSQTWR